MLPSTQAGRWLLRRSQAVARFSSFRASAASLASRTGRCCSGYVVEQHYDRRRHDGGSLFHNNRHTVSSSSFCHRSITSSSTSSFSSHAAALENQADAYNEENEQITTVNQNDVRIINVENDGKHITLQFGSSSHDNNDYDNHPSSASSTSYHASWLWSNDPRHVVLPSGQRMSTPGQWCFSNSRPRIKDARIVYCNIEQKQTNEGTEADEENDSEMPTTTTGENSFESGSSKTTPATERIVVPGPTFTDCCHPLAIYGKYPAWISATTTSAAADNDVTTTQTNNDSTKRPYLQIVWSNTKPSTTSTNSQSEGDYESTKSIYDIEWLERFQYDDESRLRHRRRTEVQPINAIRKDGPPLWYSTPPSASMQTDLIPTHDANDGLIHVNYHSIIGDDGQILQEGLFQILHSVFRDGAAIVSNTPHSATNNNNHNISQLCHAVENMTEDELPVSKVAKAMSGSTLSHGSLYGNIFHVRVGERNANNVAYTSGALCPHQDLAYYESPPGMQLLHCVVMGNGVIGGESTLIDAMAAAYRLREVRPESFEILVKCPATFVKQRDGACMTYRRPHIALAASEEEEGGSVFDREITAVHWSPPFEGPVSLPPVQVDGYYEAYADFERMLNDGAITDTNNDEALDNNGGELSRYANEFTWEHKLNPGDMLVFNNRRMLHGRRGFSAAEGTSFEESQRHLVGCYTNIDDTLNSYRVLLRERGSAAPLLNVGNGTNISP
ncbi:hypothetical protein ACHAXR_004237 [Thalassiosira sp. AJA248-18]